MKVLTGRAAKPAPYSAAAMSGGQLPLKLNGGPRLADLLSESPTRVFLPSGERLMLPWDG
jgi:hypothetical protein